MLPSTYGGYHEASDSDFTIVSISLEGHNFPSGQIAIQAIALFGNQYPTNIQNGTVYGFEGVTSGWSNYQRLTIDETKPSSSESNDIEIATLLTIILVVLANVTLALLHYFKRSKSKEKIE